MLQKISLVTGLSVFLFGCGCPSERELAEQLVGEYKLIVGSNQPVHNEQFLSSTLIIYENGKFRLNCANKNGGSEILSGTWEVDGQHIYFDRFVDCAGVWPTELADTGANLIVECSNPPIILIDPDINVFYDRVTPKNSVNNG